MNTNEKLLKIAQVFDIINIEYYTNPAVSIKLGILERRRRPYNKMTRARQARQRKVARINYKMPITFETLDQGLDWIIEYCTKNFKSFK